MPHVFGYGSLVDRASVEASIRRMLAPSDGPFVLRLNGYRRVWNVVGHSSERPEYVFTGPHGAAWQGWVTFLGLEASPGAVTPGAAWRLTDADLTHLDDRERSYRRVDVTALVEAVAGPAPDGPVVTYLPRDDVVERAAAVGPAAVVMARYLRLVERGYGSLAEAVRAEHLATFPDPGPGRVREIQVRPALPGGRNEAVDPGDGR